MEASTRIFLGDREISVGNSYLGITPVAINPIDVPGKLVPTDGLVLYVDSTVEASYSSSSSVWKDLSGNNINFTVHNSSVFPTFNATEKSLQFNGTTNALAARVTGSVSTITNNTQLAWVKLATLTPTGTSAGEGIINNGADDQFAGGFDAFEFNEIVTSRWSDIRAGGAFFVTASANETSLDWVFVGVTRQSNEYILYRNGVEIGRKTNYSPVTYNSGRIALGQRHTGLGGGWVANGWLTGSLSMALTYNRVLTQSEIQYIYDLGRT
jgi:hypothetical protein